MAPLPRDLTRIVLAVLAVGMMILFSFWIVKPFVPATIWATTIVTATWPVLLAVQKRLWGRRSLAVAVMTAALPGLFVVPFSFLLRTVVHHEHQITRWAKTAASYRLAAPPAWVAKLPLVGETAVHEWTRYSHEGTAELEATGEQAAAGIRLFLRRLAGHHGDTVISLVGRAIRGVILGTVVAGLIVAMLSGLGLAVVHVPAAVLLTAIMFLLYLAQVGTTPVLISAAIWLFANGRAGAGTFLLVWTVVVVAADGVLRPVVMKMGAELPLPLIFTGVVGGMAAFGLVGLFVGPITLAVSYTLLEAWVQDDLTSAISADGPVALAPTLAGGGEKISGA